MVDVEKEIKDNPIVLFVIPKWLYNEYSIKIAWALEKNFNRICYVAFNKPYKNILRNLTEAGLKEDKFFFIDTITSTVQMPEPDKRCIFVQSPNALTDISLAFTRAIKEKKCDTSVFDSLSTLLIYEETHSIIKFIHTIMTKARIENCRAVFILLKEDSNSEIIKDLYMFVDKTVEISG